MVSDLESRRSGPHVRTVEDSTEHTLVIDFGVDADDVHCDVVEDTLIVVNEPNGEQYEFELPGEHRRTFMQNGILTVEVDA